MSSGEVTDCGVCSVEAAIALAVKLAKELEQKKRTRELALTITKLEEALMWFEVAYKLHIEEKAA